MDDAERRHNYRVKAPPGFLREVALWPGRTVSDGRLTLEDLGTPAATGFSGTGGIALTDVSTRGVRMRLAMEAAQCLGLASARNPADAPVAVDGLHVYLKLLSPVVGAVVRNYTLFLGTRVTHVDHVPDAVLLGLHITSRGVPEKAEKAFRMFDAERYGVKELTRWCDEVARMGRGLQPAPSPGLDLEHLLAEIDAARACGVMQANRN